jgi:hypothetical protein
VGAPQPGSGAHLHGPETHADHDDAADDDTAAADLDDHHDAPAAVPAALHSAVLHPDHDTAHNDLAAAAAGARAGAHVVGAGALI